MFTTLNTCQTIRKAIGFTHGPDKPPVIVDKTGLRVSALIAIPMMVLMSDTASAPASSTDFAIEAISVTLGDNFTIKVLLHTFLTAETTELADSHEVPNAIPPSFTLGHDMFNSIAGILSKSEIFSTVFT